MQSLRFVVLLVVALLVRESVQRGTLFLNEIQAIEDPITGDQSLPIECTLWEDNMIYLDNFDSLFSPGIGEGVGVDVDGALLNGGTWVFPNDFNVAGTVTINGLLQVNGGFFTDDGDFGDNNGDGFDWSFSVEDNSGDATLAGSLNVFGQIDNSKDITSPVPGTFWVQPSGELTTLGLLQPNGGIDVANGEITVDSDGTTFASGNLNVYKDLILGTTESEFAELVPFTNGLGTAPPVGGQTWLKGQDGSSTGGSLVLAPGTGTGASNVQETGDIVIGVDGSAHDLSVSRVAASAGNAGSFVFNGQDSYGKGGDLILRAGFGAQGSTGVGGDIIFSPGQSTTGLRGFLYLGDPADGSSIPFFVERPDVTSSLNGGSTFFSGQNVTNGNAGPTRILAGDGSLAGGNLYLDPGMNGNTQGKVFFGSVSSAGTDLSLVRPTDDDVLNASPTWFIGQDSFGGDGGDLYLEAGRGASGSNGDLYISPGSSGATRTSGTIFWGTNEGHPELRVVRPTTQDSPAHDTIFRGATSTSSAGGELNLVGGSGYAGGDVHLEGASGEEDYGGDVVIRGGSGSTGGDVTIASGNSGAGETGNIFFTAGDSGYRGAEPFRPAGRPGDASAGSVFLAALGGDVVFQADQLYLDSVPFFVDSNGVVDGFQVVDTVGGVTLTLATTSGYIELNDNGNISTLIQSRIVLNSLFRARTNPYEDPITAATQLRSALSQLRAGLVAHGLIEQV